MFKKKNKLLFYLLVKTQVGLLPAGNIDLEAGLQEWIKVSVFIVSGPHLL